MLQYLTPAAIFVVGLIIVFWPMKTARTCSELPKEHYWTTIIENNVEAILKDLGAEVEGTLFPTNEEDAREMYLRWCKKLEEIEAKKEEPLGDSEWKQE